MIAVTEKKDVLLSPFSLLFSFTVISWSKITASKCKNWQVWCRRRSTKPAKCRKSDDFLVINENNLRKSIKGRVVVCQFSLLIVILSQNLVNFFKIFLRIRGHNILIESLLFKRFQPGNIFSYFLIRNQFLNQILDQILIRITFLKFLNPFILFLPRFIIFKYLILIIIKFLMHYIEFFHQIFISIF